MPPAVTIMPSPAMISVPGPMTMVTPGWMSGLPALPIAADLPSLMPMSALTMPQWSTISALVMTVSTAPCAVGDCALAHAVADHLAAAELHFLAVDGEVLLHLDRQIGVGEPHAVAGGGAEHFRIGAARAILHGISELSHHVACGSQRPRARRRSATKSTVRVWPGSKRTAVPAAMLSRMPCAFLRSNCSAALVSKKW